MTSGPEIPLDDKDLPQPLERRIEWVLFLCVFAALAALFVIGWFLTTEPSPHVIHPR